MTNEELQAHYQLGFSNEQEGKLAAAEKEYDLIIADHAAEPKISYKAYKAKLNLNAEKVEARNNLAAIMTEIFTRHEDLVQQLYYDLSIFYKTVGDADRMINNLEQLTVRFPDHEQMADSLLELGLAYQHVLNKPGKAIVTYINYFNRAGKRHPGVQVGAINLAECYNKVGQPKEAKAILKRYMKIG
jgi:predicted Zn-dependent protease